MNQSDKISEPSLTEAEIVRAEWEVTRPYDPELMRLVSFLNAVDTAEIGLTLHVKGSVVSGMLISMAQFYRLLIESFTDPSNQGERSNSEVGAAFAQFFRPSLEGAETALAEYKNAEVFLPTPRHIHLRYAQTILPGGQPFTQPLWRGRLVEIDGWSIGNFGRIPPLAE